tara:strand:- start:5259 stop:5648 length:390 start_codon:yes stop_codon:yes gene_type:complete
MSEGKKGLSVVQAHLQGQFYIVHFVHSHGGVDSEMVWTLYEEIFGRKDSIFPQYFGPFESLEALTKFCFRVCDETDEPQVNILTLEEFNQLIESSTNTTILKERLPSLGNVIANPDASSKKGLFGKLFN